MSASSRAPGAADDGSLDSGDASREGPAKTPEKIGELECRRLRALAETSFDFLQESRVDGPGLRGDARFLRDIGRELGLGAGEFPRSIEEILERFHPDDVVEAIEVRTEALERQESFHSEFRVRAADGSYLWFEEHCIPPLPDDSEQVWLGAVRNITERKRAEEELRATVDELNAIKVQLEKENVYLREEREDRHRFEQMVGESPAFLSVLEQIEQVAQTRSTVLVTGETGTGKELVARAIHRHGARSGRPFVLVNCGALPATLVESELFGHEKGAFTGAVSKRLGRFEVAHGGTLFLDEIGEMPLEVQSSLLRALESGEFERLGQNQTRRADVRLIVATNRDLTRAVEEGSFREDLFYRLSVFPIHVPPLRERKQDIPLLVSFLAEKHAQAMNKRIDSIPRAAIEALQEYDWPGNVRELSNVVERAVILTQGPALALERAWTRRESVPVSDPGGGSAKRDRLGPGGETLEAVEREHIVRVCEACNWQIKGDAGAARRLGLNPSTLYFRMKKLGIERP